MKDVIMKDVENFMMVFNKSVNETPVCELTIINILISKSDYIIKVDVEYENIPNDNFKNDCLFFTIINIKLLTMYGYHSFEVDKIFKRYSVKSGIVNIRNERLIKDLCGDCFGNLDFDELYKTF